MPGTNHTMEFGFMDALPMKTREIAKHILNTKELQQIVEIYFGIKPCREYEDMGLKPYEIKLVARQIVLTRLTALEITSYYSRKELLALVEMVEVIFDTGQSFDQIVAAQRISYPVFSAWGQNIQNHLRRFDRRSA